MDIAGHMDLGAGILTVLTEFPRTWASPSREITSSSKLRIFPELRDPQLRGNC